MLPSQTCSGWRSCASGRNATGLALFGVSALRCALAFGSYRCELHHGSRFQCHFYRAGTPIQFCSGTPGSTSRHSVTGHLGKDAFEACRRSVSASYLIWKSCDASFVIGLGVSRLRQSSAWCLDWEGLIHPVHHWSKLGNFSAASLPQQGSSLLALGSYEVNLAWAQSLLCETFVSRHGCFFGGLGRHSNERDSLFLCSKAGNKIKSF